MLCCGYPIPCTAMCFPNRCLSPCCGCCSAPCCNYNCCCSYVRGTAPPSSFGMPSAAKKKTKKKKKKKPSISFGRAITPSKVALFTPSKIKMLTKSKLALMTPSQIAMLSPSKQELLKDKMKEEGLAPDEGVPDGTRKCDPRCRARRSRPNTAPESTTGYCDGGGVHLPAADTQQMCQEPATPSRNCLSEYCPRNMNYNQTQQQYYALQQQQWLQKCYNCQLMQQHQLAQNSIAGSIDKPLTCGPAASSTAPPPPPPQYPQQCGVYNMAYGGFPNPFYNSRYSLSYNLSQIPSTISTMSNVTSINGRPSYIIKKCSTCGRVHVAPLR